MNQNLNPQQQEAVTYNGKSLMIVAGAGSGKTHVLTNRVAHILENSWAYPSQILAITFTNKAAAQMRERLSVKLGEEVGQRLWVSTFHSSCVRIIRKWHNELGLPSSFTIYDTDDTRRLIRNILHELNIDVKQFPPRLFAGKISKAKNDLIDAVQYAEFAESSGEIIEDYVSRVYTRYVKHMEMLKALDFDDLIGKTIELLRSSEEACKFYHDKLKYILVDEYQDTNHAQYLLVKLLTGANNNLTVVGDSDQSIYAFRGATIRNILEFEKDFPHTKTVLLEQNYRSVNNILTAANSVIDQNPNRKKKNLWSSKGEGPKIQGFAAHDSYNEADFIMSKIRELVNQGIRWGDVAVFFRTNSASRIIEEKLVNARIPYRLVGGTKFYDRMEVKDIIAYLYVVINRLDDIHLRRILNVPTRGIGKTTEGRVAKFAWNHGCSFGDAFDMLDDIPDISNSVRQKLTNFNNTLTELAQWIDSEQPELGDIVRKVATKTEYLSELEQSKDPQDEVRVDNINQLIEAASSFTPLVVVDDDEPESISIATQSDALNNTLFEQVEVGDQQINNQQAGGRKGLEAFLEQIALIADADDIPDNEAGDIGVVTLMTLHTAKGLEFDNVFLTGFEDGTLPHANSLNSEFELQEERRLAYVGITRAKQHLFITWASRRNMFGNWHDFIPSRFIDDIPEGIIEWIHNSSTEINHKTHNNEYDPWADESGFGSRTSRKTNWRSNYHKTSEYRTKSNYSTKQVNSNKTTDSLKELTPYQKYKLGIKE